VQATCINLETMVSEPAEAASHQAAQAAALVPVLGLSEQQQEFVSIGMELYYDLLAAVHQERQQINSDMTAAEGLEASSRLNNDGSMEFGSPTSGSSSEQLESFSDRRELLEKQQGLTSRLALLLHKEVSSCCYCFATVLQQSCQSDACVGTPMCRLCWGQHVDEAMLTTSLGWVCLVINKST
jgi:hypothetical protein